MRIKLPAQLWNEMASPELSQSINGVIKQEQGMATASLCSSEWVSDSLEGFSTSLHQFLSYLIQFLSRELQGEAVIAQQIIPQSKKTAFFQSQVGFRGKTSSSGHSQGITHKSCRDPRACSECGICSISWDGAKSDFWSCPARIPESLTGPQHIWEDVWVQEDADGLRKNESMAGRCPQEE